MQRTFFSPRFLSLADLLIFLLIGAVIYAILALGHQWRADYNPSTVIDLSVWALPRYTLFSAVRGMTAYFISLAFTLVVGYIAAKSSTAEKIFIPLLDILQSIPVLGFLPGLVLGLISIFPRTNIGLELAAIIMIFLGQVWNMTFSFYSSLKSVPGDYVEAATVIGLNWRQKLLNVELPFSAVNLAWNSVMSMAGGWFFLSICEAFDLGKQHFRLPGIGAYMSVAVEAGDTRATILGVTAMTLLIVVMDFCIWRPILSWVQRFRLEEIPGAQPVEPFMSIVLRESRFLRWTKVALRRFMFRRHLTQRDTEATHPDVAPPNPASATDLARFQEDLRIKFRLLAEKSHHPAVIRGAEISLILLVLGLLAWGFLNLMGVLVQVSSSTWVMLMRNTFWTFTRVVVALVLSTLWAVPVGIWLGLSSKRLRIAQPIIQIMASFPAPMLYPLAAGLFLLMGLNFNIGSMLLMLLGVQWYVLFNVLAGALRIPLELNYALSLMQSSRWDRWRTLYIPSVFPALVTGLVTAAGGAWNASIVAEYMNYKGTILETAGLGATIQHATETENFPLLAASLTIMVVVVVGLNRALWARLYRLAQTRFRMDL